MAKYVQQPHCAHAGARHGVAEQPHRQQGRRRALPISSSLSCPVSGHEPFMPCKPPARRGSAGDRKAGARDSDKRLTPASWRTFFLMRPVEGEVGPMIRGRTRAVRRGRRTACRPAQPGGNRQMFLGVSRS